MFVSPECLAMGVTFLQLYRDPCWEMHVLVTMRGGLDEPHGGEERHIKYCKSK